MLESIGKCMEVEEHTVIRNHTVNQIYTIM